MNTICKTDIPTANYGWNPVRGCDNKKCFLHPKNQGGCWAAQQCRLHASPWSEYEAHFRWHRDVEEWECSQFSIETDLINFNPQWFQSQYDKSFPAKPSKIAVCYQTDIAYIPKEWIQKIIDRIDIDNGERDTFKKKRHVFQFLTNDPSVYGRFEWPENCWLGFTAWDQESYSINLEKISEVMKYYDGIRWNYNENITYAYLEPLIEGIDMASGTQIDYQYLSWVIVGGQTGPGAKPLNPDWVRKIRYKCVEYGIPFYFKSWGEHVYLADNIECCTKRELIKDNKFRKYNGFYPIKDNLIDGDTWEQFPKED